MRAHDPFHAIFAATEAHRAWHGCWAYPFGDGPALGVLAAAAGATRILELGTALGYTACWFAHGAPRAKIDTVERDAEHVALARANIAASGFAARVCVLHGDFSDEMARLSPGYGMAFFDGYAPKPSDLEALRALLRPGGVLIAANLDLSDEGAAECRAEITRPGRWLTSFMAEFGRTAVCIKL